MNIKELAEKHDGYIIEQRRFFHQRPELSFQEVETTRALGERLEAMGIPVTTFPDYQGLIGVIKGGRPGRTIMLRADIDALPVEEHTGLPFSSANGNMHACGHDCHMAMQLGAARILMDIRDELPGEIRLLFQSGEETCYGARYYIEKGCLDDVDAVFGMHIWNNIDAPKINVETGDRMASCDNFHITVKGVSAHGTAPHLGRDAIVAAASIVMNLQTFVSRHNDPLNPLVVTVGTIKGGQRFNIIPNEVTMEGTVRTYSREKRKTIGEELKKIVRGTAETHGCEAEFDYQMYLGPVINEHDDLNRIARDAAVKLYGEEFLAHMDKTMGSEDFSMLMDKAPGFYCFIGCRNPALGKIYPNHNDKFDVDESVLHRGAAFYAQFAADYLNEKENVMSECGCGCGNGNKNVITFQGAPMSLLGAIRKVGDEAPDFTVIKNDMTPGKLSDYRGKKVLIAAVPSLDTGVCDLEAKRFNSEASKLPNTQILTISMDLPFAQARWCGAAGVKNLITMSDYMEGDFGMKYGLLIKELKLLTRAVLVVDEKGRIVYQQIVPEVTDQPDYAAALAAAK